MGPRVPSSPPSLPLPTIRAQGPSSAQTLPPAGKFGRGVCVSTGCGFSEVPSTAGLRLYHSLRGFRLTQPEPVFNPAAKNAPTDWTPLLSSCIEKKKKKKKTEKAKTKSPPPPPSSGKPQKPSWGRASCLFLLRVFICTVGPPAKYVSQPMSRAAGVRTRAGGLWCWLNSWSGSRIPVSELWCQGPVWLG